MSNLLKQKEKEGISETLEAKRKIYNKTRTSEHISGTSIIHDSDPEENNPQHNAMLLVHEHDLVPCVIKKVNCSQCLTCNKIFCQACGKSLDRVSDLGSNKEVYAINE